MTGQRGEGVYAIVSGQDRAFLGKAGLIANGEDIWINVAVFFDLPTRASQEIHEIDVVDAGNQLFRKLRRRDHFKKAAAGDLFQDAADSHRGFDVALFVDTEHDS
jgi:hypothetical protein